MVISLFVDMDHTFWNLKMPLRSFIVTFLELSFNFVSPFKVTVIFASSKSSVTSTVFRLLCLKSNFKWPAKSPFSVDFCS